MEQKRIPDDVVVRIKHWRKLLLADPKWEVDPDYMKWCLREGIVYLLEGEYADHWKELMAQQDAQRKA